MDHINFFFPENLCQKISRKVWLFRVDRFVLKKTYKFNSKEKFDYPRDFITCNFEYIILHKNRVYKKMLR